MNFFILHIFKKYLQLVTQQIIPKGMHTIEVAVLDDAGNGQVYLRDLNLDRRDWFYAGIRWSAFPLPAPGDAVSFSGRNE